MTWVNHTLGLQAPGAFWAGTAFVSFSVMQFLATPLLGRLSDLVGRRPVLWISLMGSALGYLILAATGRFEWVLAARVLDGITGGNISVAQAAMADITPVKDRSKAMGLIGAAFGLGFVLGPFLGGTLAASHLGLRLASEHGWNLPFLVAGGLSLLASLLVIAWLPETLSADARKAARQEESRGHALLIALERPGMPQLLAIALLAMTGFAMMEGTYSLLVNQRFNFGEREVGYLFGFIGILIVLYQGGLVRVVAKRIPERYALLAGLALMAAFLPFLPSAPWKWPFLLVMIPLAWGSGMNTTASSALASQLTPAADQGGLFGVLNAVSGVGRILGPGLGTLVFARWGYAMSYWVASAVMALALILAFTLPRRAALMEEAP
jgi:DHA1 family tetracycline resistance protein-like MFS transporter